jgi:DNA-directed RNA polymerase subunit H
LTKAKSKTETKKTVKEIKPKTTEKAKKVEPKQKTKTVVKSKPVSKGKKKVVEEKVHFLVSSHVLVPKHEIVPDSEVPSILKMYNLENKSHLPKILSDDAVIKEIGAKIGNVIRIYRKEPTGDCLYYRVVV